MVQVRTRSGETLVELIRLAVVVALTATGYALGGTGFTLGTFDSVDEVRLATSVLGALTGYLAGGLLGRGVVRGADVATERLRHIPAVQLVAAAIGASFGALLGVLLLLPAVVLPLSAVTVPIGAAVLLALTFLGGRLGADRGGELGRFVGVRGRLDVRAPSRGGGVKIVDSSALIDGRLSDVARSGFLEGVLVVPRFVIDEVTRIANGGEDHRRELGERGLATLQTLQDEGLVAVEVDDDEAPGVATVDDRLARLCRERGAALLTADADLARTVERSGVRVLNPHALADAVRSPVLPGDTVELHVVRQGREPGQGVAYLADGTMVVVEGASEAVGATCTADVTSIVQSRTGRLLFATRSGGGA